jgi:membrane protein YqaA with SNARE-associated domain
MWSAVMLAASVLMPLVGGAIWFWQVSKRTDASWTSVPRTGAERVALLLSWAAVFVGIRCWQAGPFELQAVVAALVSFALAALGYFIAIAVAGRRGLGEMGGD